jgi:hypothetical protein
MMKPVSTLDRTYFVGIEGLDKIMCIVQYWALFGVTKAFSKKEKQFESSEKHHLTNSSLRFNFHLNWVFLTAQFLRIEQLEPARNYHGAGGWYYNTADIFSPVSITLTPPPFPHPPHNAARPSPQS